MKIKQNNNLNIRNCNYKSDLDYIYSKMDDLFRLNLGKNYNPTFKLKKNFQIEILESKGKKNRKIFILELDKKQVGYLEIFINKHQATQKKRLIISKIYINEEYRKMGYGTILIEKVKVFAKLKKICSIELNSYIKNTKFYENLGFKIRRTWLEFNLLKKN